MTQIVTGRPLCAGSPHHGRNRSDEDLRSPRSETVRCSRGRSRPLRASGSCPAHDLPQAGDAGSDVVSVRAAIPSTGSRRRGSSGRGPTRLISPRRTFTSCGNSSSPVRRSVRPKLVCRGSSSVLWVSRRSGERDGATRRSRRSGSIVRNFSTVNGWPLSPIRCWRYQMPRPSATRLMIAITPSAVRPEAVTRRPGHVKTSLAGVR